jgi:hypothetical protein
MAMYNCSFIQRSNYKLQVHCCLLLLALLFTRTGANAQTAANTGFEYSVLIRDTFGRFQPLTPVNIRSTLLLGQTGSTATSPWIEKQTVTTDNYGFANIVIGQGTRTGGTATSFAGVDFSLNNYWIQIEVLNTTTNAYETFFKEALQAVPYAKVAGALAGQQGIPPGVITPFAGDTLHIPAGWLLCNGRELDNTNKLYQPLFNAIGYNWGTSNNTTKFNIPNTLGLFLRGANFTGFWDIDAATRYAPVPGANTGNNVGSMQDDALQGHQHLFFGYDKLTGDLGYDNVAGLTNLSIGSRTTILNIPANTSAHYYLPAYGLTRASAYETRPVNVSVNYIIKL